MPRQGWLFFSLLAMMLTMPFAMEHQVFHVLFRTFTVAVMVMGVYATSRAPGNLALGLALGGPMIALSLLTAVWDSRHLVVPGLVFAIAFYGHVSYTLLGQLVRDRVVTRGTIYSAVIVYMLGAVVFAALYALTEFVHPGSIRGAFEPRPPLRMDFPDALYFSMCTLTTIGYGDIVPVSSFPRILVGLEGLFGVMYPSILIARLVGLFDLQAALGAEDEAP